MDTEVKETLWIPQGGAGDTATTTDVVVEAGIDEVTETGKEQG